MSENTFCPFIKDNCRKDCKFFDENIEECFFIFNMVATQETLDMIAGYTYDLVKKKTDHVSDRSYNRASVENLYETALSIFLTEAPLT